MALRRSGALKMMRLTPSLRVTSSRSLMPGSSVGFAFQETAAPWLAMEDAAVHDDVAAREHRARIALYTKALEHGVIDAHVMRLRADHVLSRGIPDHDVGVALRLNHALSRPEAEDLGGRGGDDLDETIGADAASVDAVMPDELQAVFHARAAVGNLGEVVLAERLLVFKAERAVIGGDHLQVIVLKPVPELGQV